MRVLSRRAGRVLAVAFWVGCMGGAAVVSASEGKTEKTQETVPVLCYADETITYGALEGIWKETPAGANANFDDLPEREKAQFIARIGLNRLYAKEARARGLEGSPEFKKRYLAWAYPQLSKVYVEREIAAKVKPKDEDLIQYLPPALPQVRVRVIVKEEKASAEAIYRRLLKGEDFEKLALTESEGNLRNKGGLSEWIDVSQKGMFPPPVTERFLDAKVGTILEPFYQDIGFLIVRIEAKRSVEEQRRDALGAQRESLVLEVRKQTYEQRLAALRSTVRVVKHDDVLKELEEGQYAAGRVLLEVGEESFGPEIIEEALSGQHGPQVLGQNLDTFIERALIAQEAVRVGLDRDPLFKKAKEAAETEVLSGLLTDAVAGQADREPLLEKDLRDYYEANPRQFTTPEERRLRIIQCESNEEAQKALARLEQGESFADVAREVSRHRESADKGGDIGYYDAQSVPDPVREGAFSLRSGDFTHTPVVGRGESGMLWLLVKVDDVREAALRPFDSVKSPTLESRLRTLMRTKALAEATSVLEKKYGYRNCYQPTR